MVTVTREDLTDFEKEFEEQASRYYNYNGPYDYWALRECCKELMVKAKKELMKEAISCKVFWLDGPLLDYTQEQQDNALERIGAHVGDSVKLIILKDED